MPLPQVVQNVISDQIDLAAQTLELRDKLELVIARYNENDVYGESAGTAVTAQFPHLNQSEIGNCINAFQAVLDALGDNSSGQAVNLIKMHP